MKKVNECHGERKTERMNHLKKERKNKRIIFKKKKERKEAELKKGECMNLKKKEWMSIGVGREKEKRMN